MYWMKKAVWSIFLVFFFSAVFCTAYSFLKEEREVEKVVVAENNIDESVSEKPSQIVQVTDENSFEPVFSYNSLSEENIYKIKDVSWKSSAPVSLDELSYIKVTYWGFDDKKHIGELIVHEKVAEEVVEIFQELYEEKFPIEKVRLIDEYEAKDDLSMEDNNTSSFCFRKIEGSKKLSMHSYGLAIDINPLQNPYVKGDNVSPEGGKKYLDRHNVRKGMIVKDDICYKAFKSKGWIWGGDWKTVKDYQHFQKNIHIKELK